MSHHLHLHLLLLIELLLLLHLLLMTEQDIEADGLHLMRMRRSDVMDVAAVHRGLELRRRRRRGGPAGESDTARGGLRQRSRHPKNIRRPGRRSSVDRSSARPLGRRTAAGVASARHDGEQAAVAVEMKE